jgi:phosphohistidine phosphatase
MELYFIRHAIAVDRLDPDVKNDEQRWLTDEGIKKMEKAARGLRTCVELFDTIFTSHYVRAKQTAEIVERVYSVKIPIIITADLAPGADFDRLLAVLNPCKPDARVAIVGHEPDMSSLISTLVSSGTAEIEMKKGSVCRVDVDSNPKRGDGILVWLLPPRLLRVLA